MSRVNLPYAERGLSLRCSIDCLDHALAAWQTVKRRGAKRDFLLLTALQPKSDWLLFVARTRFVALVRIRPSGATVSPGISVSRNEAAAN